MQFSDRYLYPESSNACKYSEEIFPLILTESVPFIWQSLYGYNSVSEIFLVMAILVSNPAAT